mmetsp:Transcript_6058/g.10278  ORF Transcript_6058/g.10278 Transcript_6058/m.10278 type:complete len:80 (-) Transcript_6058:12-251(-)
MGAEDFYSKLHDLIEPVTEEGNKREQVDELRHKMAKLSYKQRKYDFYSQLDAHPRSGECDPVCARNCFTSANSSSQTPA